MKIDNNKIWHTPIKAYSDYLQAVEDNGLDKVNTLDAFQKTRETRALALLCFALYKHTGDTWYLQLDKSEATDGRIMRMSPKDFGSLEKGGIEITTFMRRPDGSVPRVTLLEQLKKTKTFEKYHKYGKHDMVLVELGNSMTEVDGLNFNEIAQYLRDINAPYALWAVEQIEHENPDTIARVTMCTPEVNCFRMNVGEAWHEQLENGIRGTLISKRTADPKKVGVVSNGEEQITQAVWELND